CGVVALAGELRERLGGGPDVVESVDDVRLEVVERVQAGRQLLDALVDVRHPGPEGLPQVIEALERIGDVGRLLVQAGGEAVKLGQQLLRVVCPSAAQSQVQLGGDGLEMLQTTAVEQHR